MKYGSQQSTNVLSNRAIENTSFDGLLTEFLNALAQIELYQVHHDYGTIPQYHLRLRFESAHLLKI